MYFCWYTSSMDKRSGVLGQHTAVSQTSVSKHRWLPRKHAHVHNTKWQSVFCLQQTNEKTAQLLGTSRSAILDTSWLFGEQRGGWLVWLIFPCWESMTGSIYGRTRMVKKKNLSLITQFTKHLDWFTSKHVVQQYHAHKQLLQYMLVILFGGTCCHGGLQRKKTNVKGR